MADERIKLRGIAWNHSRGFTPMVATAQRYGELHPEVEIIWEKRSLQAFADAPIERLAGSFDILVIDHPFAGFAARHPAVLLDLNTQMPASLLADHAANSVGESHASYEYESKRCAIAIDAATPISGWREDLLGHHRLVPPTTWEELLELARRGFVAIAGIPVDCLMNFFMLCHTQGEAPCVGPARVVSAETGMAALCLLRELSNLLPSETWARNPIRVWDLLARSNGPACYCPFAYGYSNYARPGYAPHPLKFGGLVTHGGRRLRPTLGGTGLAVSGQCRHPEIALDYATLVAGATWQRTLYFDSGGQPAHRTAWIDKEVNRHSNSFFHDTLATLDDSWVRPRYAGYLKFQDQGGEIVRDYLLGKAETRDALLDLEAAYRRSIANEV